MGTTALGVSPNTDGVGVTPLAHRQVLGAQWNNTGIITGLSVTGRSDLRYNVSAGVAVCSRGDTDGKTLAYYEGGQTPATSAGDPSNPRIDVIWVKANNQVEYKDSDNLVTVGVTQGTPSASPVAPSIPAGCTVLRRMRVPASMTVTTSATASDSADYAIPYSASMGRLAYFENRAEGPANFSNKVVEYYDEAVTFDVPTDRLLELRYRATACCAMRGHPDKPTENAGEMACWFVCFQLDGQDVPNSGGQFQVSRAWQPVMISTLVQVGAGRHTVRIRNHRVPWGENVYFVCHSNKEETFSPRVLEVWDRGTAK